MMWNIQSVDQRESNKYLLICHPELQPKADRPLDDVSGSRQDRSKRDFSVNLEMTDSSCGSIDQYLLDSHDNQY